MNLNSTTDGVPQSHKSTTHIIHSHICSDVSSSIQHIQQSSLLTSRTRYMCLLILQWPVESPIVRHSRTVQAIPCCLKRQLQELLYGHESSLLTEYEEQVPIPQRKNSLPRELIASLVTWAPFITLNCQVTVNSNRFDGLVSLKVQA